MSTSPPPESGALDGALWADARFRPRHSWGISGVKDLRLRLGVSSYDSRRLGLRVCSLGLGFPGWHSSSVAEETPNPNV